ncbi:hypothetical protein XENTR_v10017556 [Xenopus tropicalis]|nr:hypothetical protein XENTR_v10017556 [Xenopus tropicalis]
MGSFTRSHALCAAPPALHLPFSVSLFFLYFGDESETETPGEGRFCPVCACVGAAEPQHEVLSSPGAPALSHHSTVKCNYPDKTGQGVPTA